MLPLPKSEPELNLKGTPPSPANKLFLRRSSTNAAPYVTTTLKIKITTNAFLLIKLRVSQIFPSQQLLL